MHLRAECVRKDLMLKERKYEAWQLWNQLEKAEREVEKMRKEQKKLRAESQQALAQRDSALRLLEIATREKRNLAIALRHERTITRRNTSPKTDELAKLLDQAQAQKRKLALALDAALAELQARTSQNK
uniref:Uncharacterized protein n=1 Tax=Aureoumbra lagunensis TaxID=44058 RepID=A0A7S3NH64_9STRA|mmetsp:Transcript_12079/g.18151  ORF Transcript_12079/g.18151 Transcript_12079/m.18151 type:complete len:129 (-) Transcript_12079:272-658(-)